MTTEGTSRLRRVWFVIVSGVILLLLGLQTITALSISGGRLRPSPHLWPFLDYPVYSTVHREGDLIPRNVVFVEFGDGEWHQVDHVDFDMNYWIFRDIQGALEEADAERLRPFAAAYELHNGRRIVAFRMENHAVEYTREGTREVEPIPVSEVRLDELPEADG